MVVKVYMSGISGNKEVSRSRGRQCRQTDVPPTSFWSFWSLTRYAVAGEETTTESHHDIGQQEHNVRPGGHH